MSNLVEKIKEQKESGKKEAAFFAVADINHFKYAVSFWRSMTKFHDPKVIDMYFYTNMTDEKELAKLPKGLIIKDLTPYLEDSVFFYRQKPAISEPLLDEYNLVVGFDTDQLVLAPLDDVLKVLTYDVGVVINWNRFDEKYYPPVHLMPYAQPIEYYNCGMVALRSKKFAHHWNVLCHSIYFDRSQYKEQDMLNLLAHFGNYNVWSFDAAASKEADLHWYGILSKGELVRAEIKDGKPIIPKGLGATPFPPAQVNLHMIHMGGGNGVPKDNWASLCSPELMEYINKIIQ